MAPQVIVVLLHKCSAMNHDLDTMPGCHTCATSIDDKASRIESSATAKIDNAYVAQPSEAHGEKITLGL